MKTCLVTGGAGFIGSHICEALLSMGNRVVCVDNLITGSELNIKHLKSNNNFSFVKHDMINFFDPKEKIDYIFHFASPASPIDYQEHPIETLLVNSIGTKNCLDIARKNKSILMFASTSEIYGDPLVHPQVEEYWGNVNPNGVRSCYDESKRFGESIVFVYQKKYGITTKIIRIFNTYGPKMQKDDGRVISNFVNQALIGENLKVNGDGSQTRSFCYVDDLVEGILLTMFSDKTNNDVFNLGNPDEYSILEIANIILGLIKTKSKIIFSKMPADDPKKRKPNIDKISNLVNWFPRTKLKEGLLKTIDYFDKLS